MQEANFQIDVTLCFLNQNKPGYTELIERYPALNFISGGSFKCQPVLLLGKLLKALSSETNLSLQYKSIAYYSHEGEIFVNCGQFPFSEQVKIKYGDFMDEKGLQIRVKDDCISKVYMFLKNDAAGNVSIRDKQHEESIEGQEQDSEEQDIDQQKEQEIKEKKIKKNSARREKERRIGLVLEKVTRWLNLIKNPPAEQKEKKTKITLQWAANHKDVNISKKSLDDYLYLIKFGYNHKFDFNNHYNNKIGTLRKFVKRIKQREKQD